MALYFLYLMILSVVTGNWVSLPFLSIFFAGFSYVAAGTIGQFLARLAQPKVEEVQVSVPEA